MTVPPRRQRQLRYIGLPYWKVSERETAVSLTVRNVHESPQPCTWILFSLFFSFFLFFFFSTFIFVDTLRWCRFSLPRMECCFGARALFLSLIVNDSDVKERTDNKVKRFCQVRRDLASHRFKDSLALWLANEDLLPATSTRAVA